MRERYIKGEDINNVEIKASLDKNLVYIQSIFDKASDLVVKRFQIGINHPINVAIIYISGISEKKVINDNILKNLMVNSRKQNLKENITTTGIRNIILNTLLPVAGVTVKEHSDELIQALLKGKTILLVDNLSEGFSLSTKNEDSRGQEPETETVVRGPKEGFTEDYNTNISLIRRRIKTPDLKFEDFVVGRVSKTDVVIAYLQGVVEQSLVEEVRERIRRIDIDIINESANIEQLIEDDPYSPFPQINNTERPDGVASALNEGRIAIIIDGTPFVLLLPSVFIHFLQSVGDYYERFLFSNAIRLLRLLAFFTALLAPSVYVAITTYHQEMIPTPLLISIVASRTGVPFPSVLEALLMEISFEALREAGLRLPRPVGQAVSIVGALVIGEAAVQAGLVSRAMVIVVALTGIASFIIPAYNMGISIRLLRFPIMFLAGSFGMFGITFAFLALLIHLSSLRSFGIPYLSPITPINLSGLKDSIFKVPEWMKNKRSTFIVKEDKKRIRSNAKPGPSNKQGEDNA
ncbi:spore germination protein [Iocasia frigidifontis]|uniref:Spore germination protein n=1 Tax=Iocasia fonsfrigidae TaxID=2682810 RepID=A0A8A7KEP3_9FIRM|nr:spore germination protein [Iocasia fonsfrigidae]QTL97929.1 spore germination protein [Iocasia fonsfrigidae]